MLSQVRCQNPCEIESIEVFKGPSAVAFGMRGANGVINITTRRGGRSTYIPVEKPNQVVYTPSGYQQPVELYSPKYETREARQSSIPDYRTTIFWKPDLVTSEDGKVSFDFYASTPDLSDGIEKGADKAQYSAYRYY